MSIPNPKIVQMFTRLGAGGPPVQAVLLTREMAKLGYSSVLVTGSRSRQDGDMSYLLRADDPVFSIPELSRAVSPWRDLQALFALYRFLRRERPQVVHTHTAKAGALGRIAARLAGVPVVVHTFHGNVLNHYFSEPVNWTIRQCERLLALFTDGICVLAPQQAAELASYRIASSEKVHIIPLGMDFTRLSEIASLLNLERAIRNGGRITVGWMGRFVPIKNIPLLLSAVRETLRRTDRVRFVVAGDGPESPQVAALARELGPERFEWLGWREDVEAVLAECDVMMQTSRNEGTPVSLIQGMAAGRPFVSTPAGGVVDMVSGPLRSDREGCRWFDNAILAEPDPCAFAAAFCALAENPEAIRTMGRHAAGFACASYSLSALTRSLDELFSDLLSRKSARKAVPFANFAQTIRTICRRASGFFPPGLARASGASGQAPMIQAEPQTEPAAGSFEEGSTTRPGAARSLIGGGRPFLFVDNDLGTFLWHRLALAQAARDAGFEVHVAAPAGPQTADLARNGFGFHPIPLTRRGINPFREIRTVLALRNLYRALKPALIHHLRVKPVLYGMLAARLTKRPAVANSLTGLGYLFTATGRKAAALRRIAELGMRVALRHRNTTVIFENPDDQRTFVDARLVQKRRTVVVAGSGVDVDFFRQTSFAIGTPVVLLASRMLWDKGVGEFVEAARMISARGIRARFALVGDTDAGNPSAVPREQLQKWHDEGVVEWWGFRQDMQAVLERSHVVCLPSSYGEGIPRVLIEAAACGRPLVTTDAPGCREIVRDGVNGYLVPVKDAGSLANALQKLLIDPDLRMSMGANGRELVLSGYSLEKVLASNLAVYEDLLSYTGSGCPVPAQEMINLLTAVSGSSAASRVNSRRG